MNLIIEIPDYGYLTVPANGYIAEADGDEIEITDKSALDTLAIEMGCYYDLTSATLITVDSWSEPPYFSLLIIGYAHLFDDCDLIDDTFYLRVNGFTIG